MARAARDGAGRGGLSRGGDVERGSVDPRGLTTLLHDRGAWRCLSSGSAVAVPADVEPGGDHTGR